jgi:hypothetical protein
MLKFSLQNNLMAALCSISLTFYCFCQ